MKFVKVLFALCMVIAVLAGCKSTAQTTAPSISLDSTASVEIIEHKGTSLGISTVPPWLSEYMFGNGTRSVEALPAYKDMYVIVGSANGPTLQQVETWAKNFDAQQQIGATINTRVASVFKAHENLLPDDDNARRRYDNALNTLVTATYTGARQESDWWTHVKVTERGKEPEIRYTSYVIYTIPQRILDDQIRSQIVKLKDENPELTAAFDAVTAQLLERGLEWD